MMRLRGVLEVLEVREYDMFSSLAEGAGNAGVSTDDGPAAPGGVGTEVPGGAGSEGGTLPGVDAKA